MLRSTFIITALCVYSEAQEDIPFDPTLDTSETTIQKLLEATVVLGDPNEVLDLPYRLGAEERDQLFGDEDALDELPDTGYIQIGGQIDEALPLANLPDLPEGAPIGGLGSQYLDYESFSIPSRPLGASANSAPQSEIENYCPREPFECLPYYEWDFLTCKCIDRTYCDVECEEGFSLHPNYFCHCVEQNMIDAYLVNHEMGKCDYDPERFCQ
jgi:hypothetical protein